MGPGSRACAHEAEIGRATRPSYFLALVVAFRQRPARHGGHHGRCTRECSDQDAIGLRGIDIDNSANHRAAKKLRLPSPEELMRIEQDRDRRQRHDPDQRKRNDSEHLFRSTWQRKNRSAARVVANNRTVHRRPCPSPRRPAKSIGGSRLVGEQRQFASTRGDDRVARRKRRRYGSRGGRERVPPGRWGSRSRAHDKTTDVVKTWRRGKCSTMRERTGHLRALSNSGLRAFFQKYRERQHPSPMVTRCISGEPADASSRTRLRSGCARRCGLGVDTAPKMKVTIHTADRVA